MSFSVERPYAFFFLILLLPALIITFRSFKTIGEYSVSNKRARSSFVLRTVLRSLAFVLLVFSFAGISWGSRLVPVQKSNHSVSFVFDISYSMEAPDTPLGKTRLASAAEYASNLLDHMENISVSLVLAKGDGVVAIPLTEDKEAIRLLLSSLSPKLLTSVGSSLGSGIDAAISSVPEQFSSSASIWLFTDGEETDDALLSSLNDALKAGFPVTIVGFGSEKESQVLAGDGVTKVSTALRKDKIEKMVESANKANTTAFSSSVHSLPKVSFVEAASVGSASLLLKSISFSDKNGVVSYETKEAPRYRFFLSLALIFFVLSFVAGELNLVKKRIEISVSIIFSLCLFTSCSARFKDGAKIFEGSIEWNRENYQEAVANFLTVIENSSLRGDNFINQYALYALASTYLSQGETEAAMSRFSMIPNDASDEIRFAVAYNSGVIAHRAGEYALAAECFKNALLIDGNNVDAKINLELSLEEVSVQSKSEEHQIDSISITKDEDVLEQALYSILRESELSEWKNRMQDQSGDAVDY